MATLNLMTSRGLILIIGSFFMSFSTALRIELPEATTTAPTEITTTAPTATSILSMRSIFELNRQSFNFLSQQCQERFQDCLNECEYISCTRCYSIVVVSCVVSELIGRRFYQLSGTTVSNETPVLNSPIFDDEMKTQDHVGSTNEIDIFEDSFNENVHTIGQGNFPLDGNFTEVIAPAPTVEEHDFKKPYSDSLGEQHHFEEPSNSIFEEENNFEDSHNLAASRKKNLEFRDSMNKEEEEDSNGLNSIFEQGAGIEHSDGLNSILEQGAGIEHIDSTIFGGCKVPPWSPLAKLCKNFPPAQ